MSLELKKNNAYIYTTKKTFTTKNYKEKKISTEKEQEFRNEKEHECRTEK